MGRLHKTLYSWILFCLEFYILAHGKAEGEALQQCTVQTVRSWIEAAN